MPSVARSEPRETPENIASETIQQISYLRRRRPRTCNAANASTLAEVGFGHGNKLESASVGVGSQPGRLSKSCAYHAVELCPFVYLISGGGGTARGFR